MSFGKREHPRVAGSTTASLEILDEAGEPVPDREELVCPITDISEGGVGCTSDESVPEGSRLNITMPLGDSFIVLEGEVRRATEPDEHGDIHLGIVFSYVPESAIEALRRTVEHRRTIGM